MVGITSQNFKERLMDQLPLKLILDSSIPFQERQLFNNQESMLLD